MDNALWVVTCQMGKRNWNVTPKPLPHTLLTGNREKQPSFYPSVATGFLGHSGDLLDPLSGSRRTPCPLRF